MVIGVAVPLLAGDQGSPRPSTDDRVTDLGLLVEHQLEAARMNAFRGTLDLSALARQARNAAEALEGIEAELREHGDTSVETTLAKLESIRRAVHNLRLVSRTGEIPLALRSIAESPRWIQAHQADGSFGPSNDDCESAALVDLGTVSGSLESATNDGQASCGASLYSPDVWFVYEASESTEVFAESAGSSFDTVLSVHSECPGTIDNEIACNDDSVGLQSSVSFSATPGELYVIRLSGVNGATGNYTLTLSYGGSFAGSVTSADTGDAVQALVEAYDGLGFSAGSTWSDEQGDYEIGALRSGYWFATADPIPSPGHVLQLYEGHNCAGDPPTGCDVTDGDRIGVVAGETTPGINFELVTQARVEGTVTDDTTGLPIFSAHLQAFDSDGEHVFSGYTDEDGSYEFDLVPGTYVLTAGSNDHLEEGYDDIPCPGGPGAGCDIADLDRLELEFSTTVNGIDFALQRLAGVSGRVVDRQSAAPLAGKTVSVSNSQYQVVKSTNTDANGAFLAGGLEDGTYYVHAEGFPRHLSQMYDGVDCPGAECDLLLADPVVIAEQTSVTGVDFDLITLGAVAGSVVETGSLDPLVGIRVCLHELSGTVFGCDFTDLSGGFLVERVRGGEYFATATGPEHVGQLYDDLPCPAGCDPTEGTPITVTNGQVTGGIDFQVTPKGGISGYVVDDVTSQYLSGVTVSVYNSQGTLVEDILVNNGLYSVPGLDSGTYYVTAGGGSSPIYLTDLFNGLPCWSSCDVTTGTPVEVHDATTTSGIYFRLKQTGAVSGLLLDQALVPIWNVLVRVQNRATGDETTKTSNDQGYHVTGLVPGEYRVVADARHHRDEVWDDFACTSEYPTGCEDIVGTTVLIEPGATAAADFQLISLGRLTGTVIDAETDQPLEDVKIKAYDESGNVVEDASTDSQGVFTLSRLWPGNYFLATELNSSPFLDQVFDGIPCPGGPPEGCTPHLDGTPIPVGFETDLDGFDFFVTRMGSIEGSLTNAVTSQPIVGRVVRAWNADEEIVASSTTNSQGSFRLERLLGGTYFVATEPASSSNPEYIDESFDNIPCWLGPPAGCDVSKGTPVAVEDGVATRFVDFDLAPLTGSSVTGLVTDSVSGEPLQRIAIDLWHESTGELAASVLTSPAGTYLVTLDPGQYYCSTDNNQGWVNQIWQGIECVGSPYNHDCDPSTGDVITLEPNEITVGISFQFRPKGLIFADRFESGDLSEWGF